MSEGYRNQETFFRNFDFTASVQDIDDNNAAPQDPQGSSRPRKKIRGRASVSSADQPDSDGEDVERIERSLDGNTYTIPDLADAIPRPDGRAGSFYARSDPFANDWQDEMEMRKIEYHHDPFVRFIGMVAAELGKPMEALKDKSEGELLFRKMSEVPEAMRNQATAQARQAERSQVLRNTTASRAPQQQQGGAGSQQQQQQGTPVRPDLTGPSGNNNRPPEKTVPPLPKRFGQGDALIWLLQRDPPPNSTQLEVVKTLFNHEVEDNVEWMSSPYVTGRIPVNHEFIESIGIAANDLRKDPYLLKRMKKRVRRAVLIKDYAHAFSRAVASFMKTTYLVRFVGDAGRLKADRKYIDDLAELRREFNGPGVDPQDAIIRRNMRKFQGSRASESEGQPLSEFDRWCYS